MRTSIGVVCLTAVIAMDGASAIPAVNAPQQLSQQRNETLQQVLQRSRFVIDQSAQEEAMLLTCVYQRAPKTAAGGDSVYFWLGQTPRWLATSANRELLQGLVKGTATNCPAAWPDGSSEKGRVATGSRPSLKPAEIPPSAGGAGLQPAVSATSAKTKVNGTLGAADLKTTQLDSAFLAMYLGNFSSVPFERSDPSLVSLMEGYMNGYWDTCSRASSPDRTQITRQECTGGYYHAVNRFGGQIGPDVCHGWEDVPTGKWADRKLYSAMRALQGQAERGLLKGIFSNVQNARSMGDMYGNTINKASRMESLRKEAISLVEQNGCDSPALAHFEQNLLHFASGGRAVSLDPAAQAAQLSAATSLPQKADYRKLLGDAVLQASGSWLINKYVPQSVTNVSVTRRDGGGQVEEIEGSYRYQGMGNGNGTVKLSFVDGIPACLYFWDQPANCNPVGKTLLADWDRGYYH